MHQRARWLVLCVQELIANLAEDRKVREVGHERGKLDEVARAGACGVERGDEVTEHLTGLRREVPEPDELALVIERDLAGDDDRRAA